MSAKTKPKKKSDPSRMLCWFEIPADDIARAKKFYSSLFGWKINPMPNAAIGNYHHLDTGGPDASPDGGLMPRMCEGQPITNYIYVPSVTRFAAKVKKLGGKICTPKVAVPGMGYFIQVQDTEKNLFALWEMNPKAK